MSLFFVLAGLGGVNLTLSGETITSVTAAPTDAHARLKIDNDGNVYKSEDTGSINYVQIDTGTDWLRPAAKAPDNYEVRYTNLTNDPLTSATAAQDAWHPLSSGDFVLVLSETGTGSSTSSFDVEIRQGSAGSAAVSASYTLNAEAT